MRRFFSTFILFGTVLITAVFSTLPAYAALGDDCSTIVDGNIVDGIESLAFTDGECLPMADIKESVILCTGSIDIGGPAIYTGIQSGIVSKCFLFTTLTPSDEQIVTIPRNAVPYRAGDPCPGTDEYVLKDGDNISCLSEYDQTLIAYYIRHNNELPSLFEQAPPGVERPELTENSFLCISRDEESGLVCVVDETQVNCLDGFIPDPIRCTNLGFSANECLTTGPFPCVSSAPVPTESTEPDVPLGLAQKIQNLYAWAVALAGLVALGLIIFGGVLYASSAGNPSRMTEAKSWITHALMGLFMLLGAYLILGFINPDLTKLEDIFLQVNVNPQSGGLELGEGVTAVNGVYPGEGNNTVIVEGGFSCPVGEGFNHYTQNIGNFWNCRCFNFSTPSGPHLWPTECPAGCNTIANSRPHIGIDIDAAGGSSADGTIPVYAAEDGTVTTSSNSGAGNILHLSGQHADWAYMHLDRHVVTGGHVNAGQLIAYMGDTGTPGAVHLHFEIRSKTIPYANTGENAGQANYDPCAYLNTTCGGFTCPDRSMYGAGGFVLESGSVTIVPPQPPQITPPATPPVVPPGGPTPYL